MATARSRTTPPLHVDLEAWLRFDNFERPHRKHRTGWRRPAEIFYTDRLALPVAKGWDADGFRSQTVRP